MNAIKLLSAIFLLIVSTSVNALIVDGSFTAQVMRDRSDEGVWSKDLRGSEVTGTFWFDTELAPPSLTPIYESETNSWTNFIINIDGKTIDISKPENVQDFVSVTEEVVFNRYYNEFRLSKGITIRDSENAFLTTGAGLWFFPSDDYLEVYFNVSGSITEEQRFESHLEMVISDYSVSIREAKVPEPSSLALIFIGMAALAFRRRMRISSRQ